jgi:hypothetical protein
VCVAVILVTYFLLVAVLVHEQLEGERKLRQLEASFRYDKRGTLYNGTQPNIAFRIKTFNEILSNLGTQVGTAKAKSILQRTGELAAQDFAERFPAIYDENVRRFRGGGSWDELDFTQKLEEWLEYDSHTGWGILTKKVDAKTIKISIMHLEKLYQGEGGKLFASFLAGYCQTVLCHILEGHGGFRDCTSARLSKAMDNPATDKEKVEIEFELK